MGPETLAINPPRLLPPVNRPSIIMLTAIALGLLMSPSTTSAPAGKVEVAGEPGAWKLLHSGKPYVIRGVGGTTRMEDLVASGGNSMRTWGADKAGEELDACQKHSLTLTIGVWLGHKSYFDYNDDAKVKQQLESSKAVFQKHKDHPALLMWGIGNEMEAEGNDVPAVWIAVEQIAKAAKQIDPNHPTMTVVAEISQQKIDHIKKYAPSIDVLGVNSYGGLPTLPKRLKEFGWDKPFVVTEYGPLGPWERPKTPWGAALEQTSTEKAAYYEKNYQDSIAGQSGWCLGSYAFLWGDKQEETPTWFGMFLPSGERTAAIDVLTKAWTGHWPKNRAPSLSELSLDIAQKNVPKGSQATAIVKATDPDGDPLTYLWELRREAENKAFAGQGEQRPGVIKGVLDNSHGTKVEFKVPDQPGAYRVYITVKDGKGNAATANLPFHVQG